MAKILVTGSNGMLGRTIRAVFKKHQLIPADLPDADITDPAGFDAILANSKPDAVIHCAAMTAVDKCESEPETAFRVNAFGSACVASACAKHGARLIAVSTDYVFDGLSDAPYNEFDIPTGGMNVYGRSKFAGENAVRELCADHVVARISWLYGPGGPSFVHTMRKLALSGAQEIKVVNDQIGNPTSTCAVARKLLEIIDNPALRGTFHLTCEGEASWHEFAAEIFRLLDLRVNLIPCSSCEYPRSAKRPANSRLDKMMLRFAKLPPMPHWKDALAEFTALEFPASNGQNH